MTRTQIRNCVEIGQRMSSLGSNLLLQGDLLSDLGEVAARLQESDAQRTALAAIYQRAELVQGRRRLRIVALV